MKFGLFKKIIDEISPLTEIVYLHGFGESLLHPKIFEYIAYARKKKLKTGLSTNATLLNKEYTKKFLTSDLDYLIFAVDGATKETYEKIRLGAIFEKTEANIKYFLKEAKKRKKVPFTVIQFINLPENENEVEQFIAKWQGSGVNAVRIKPKIALKMFDKKETEKKRNYCFHIFRQLNITWDGYVMACCEDINCRFPLGNVKEKKLSEIWNGEKMRLLRDINFKGEQDKVSICKNCNYPQPTKTQAIGVFLLDHLTLKKILPFLERYFGL